MAPVDLASQVLLNECKITVEPNGKKKTIQTYKIQINNKESNWLAEIGIRHDPKQKFTFKYAAIYDKSGKEVRKLKKKEITTRSLRSSMAFFQDDMISEFTLYHPTFPYIIEYSYEIVEAEYVVLKHWYPSKYSSIPTVLGKLEIQTPVDFSVNIDQNGAFEFNETIIEKQKKYSWSIVNIDKITDQIYAPNIYEMLPFVKVVSENFTFGVEGSNKSWADFGEWIHKLNEGTDDLPQSEKDKLKTMVAGLKDKREVIKKVYHYLQDHTTYVLVMVEEGGLQSYPASYVCENKYGDCKALTTYMKSMLKSLDIESNYTVIYAGDDVRRVNENIPSSQFNHVILTVPIESDTIWIENTSNSLPFNYIGTFTQNRKGLAVDAKGSKILASPALLTDQVLNERQFSFKQSNNETWSTSAHLNLRGDNFEDIRYYKTNNKESKLDAKIIDVIDLDKFDLDDWEFEDYHRDSTHVKIKLNGNLKNPIRKVANMEVINPLRIKLPEFEKPDERLQDVRINCPINKLDKLSFNLEESIDKNVQIPDNFSLSSSYGEYKVEYKKVDYQIEVTEHFKLFAGDIDLNSYSDFYQFMNDINKIKKQSAIIIE